MSVRGLVVALLCGALGVGLGALVAYAARPGTTVSAGARPVAAVSPSVPIDVKTQPTYAPDINYPILSPDLPLPPPDHTIGNHLASWSYHVPAGWEPFAVCRYAGECPPQIADDTPLTPRQAARVPEVRFRPPNEPPVGGYSIWLQMLDNSTFNPEQLVATKIVGFRQEFTGQHFSVLRRTPSAVYFTYTYGPPDKLRLRYNFFQWFQAPGQAGRDPSDVGGRAQARRARPEGPVHPLRRQRPGLGAALPPGQRGHVPQQPEHGQQQLEHGWQQSQHGLGRGS